MKKFLSFIKLSFLILLLSSSLHASPTGPEIIKLGFIGPLSGDLASYGNDEKNAIEMALQEINSSNYIPGQQLSVVYEDGKCSGKDAAIAAQKLVNVDKVKIILGGICSGETLGAAPITEKAKVILFAVFSSHPDISQAGDYVFRTAPSDIVGAQAAARYVNNKAYKKIAIITENTDYAIGFHEVFVADLKAAGAVIVADEFFNPKESDFKPLIMRIKQKKPEILLINPQGAAAGLILKQLRESAWRGDILGTYAFSSKGTHDAAGGIKYLEGLPFVDIPQVTTQKGKEFLEKFKKRFTAPQVGFDVVLRYESVYLIADAIKQHGVDTEAIRKHLLNLPTYKGLAFNYRFYKNGDVVGIPYSMMIVKNGEVVELTEE